MAHYNKNKRLYIGIAVFILMGGFHIQKIGTRSVHVGSLSKLRARHFKLKLYVAKHCDHVKHAAISQVMLKLSMLFRLRERCLVKNQHVKDKRREHCAVSF